MQCTLLIPHLLLPGEIGEDASRGLALQALEKFLARANRLTFAPIGAEAWLCQAFEVEKQHDWPIAPLALSLEGCDPGAACWFCADPVHLQLQRNKLLLVEGAKLAISRIEAESFITILNQHFAGEQMLFVAPNTDRWYLRLPYQPILATHALSEVIGTDVRTRLPAGKDARKWHGLLNEIQMLLHNHPRNSDREAAGALPVNSVWLWGGGTKPAVPGRHFSRVWSNDMLACSLAAAAGIDAAPLPHDAMQWLRSAEPSFGSEAEHLIVLDYLDAAMRQGNLASWRDELSALSRNWLGPLLEALGKRLSRIAMILPGAASCERFELSPSAMRRFWRANVPLSAYLSPPAER